MVVRFSKWGDSVALRIPRQFLNEIGAVEGMSADIKVENGKLVIVPFEEVPRYELSDLLAGLRKRTSMAKSTRGALSAPSSPSGSYCPDEGDFIVITLDPQSGSEQREDRRLFFRRGATTQPPSSA